MGAILFTLVMATAPTSPSPTATRELPQTQLQQCQAWGPRPPECVEPPLREMFKAYVGWRPEGEMPPHDQRIIRRASQMTDYDAPLPGGAFPAFMRSGDQRIDARVQMNLVIGADGAVKSCSSGKVKANINTPDRKFVDIPADPGLGAKTCEIIRATRTFRPAIDAGGNPLESTIPFDAHYSRERYEMLAPPPPPPPSRWIGRAPWGADKVWPPNYYPTQGIRFAAPRFKDFLSDTKKLPKQALVGVLVDFAPDGRALNCDLGLPSGDKRIDDATCAAMMTVQNMPVRFQVRGLPMEVNWKGSKASIVLAGQPVMPGLAAPVQIPASELPAANPPRWPVVVRVLLDPQGMPLSCMVDRPSYVDTLDAASCRIARETARYTPGKNAFGHPAISGVDVRVDWTKGTLYWTGY